MNEKDDIFDCIMRLSCLSFIFPFYKKNKEILLYLFFGGLTFLVSIGSYAFFEFIFRMSPLIANIFSWILAVGFAYITNRIWVFTTIAHEGKKILKEISVFFTGRVITLIVEETILFVGISILGFGSIVVKIIGQIIVIILNYFISKIIVFSSKK